MADPAKEKVQKLFESRLRAEKELEKIQNEVVNAVNNSERRVRVERLIASCNEAMTKAFSKNEQLLELAKKTNDPESATSDLEKWLNDTTVQNDEILKKAREYIDQYPQSENPSQSSQKSATVKTKSSKRSGSKLSKTSSQRQRDLIIAQQRREEIEKQNEASLRLAKQKQELELEKQELDLQRMREEQERLQKEQERLRKEQALKVQELEEENRKRLAEATLAELELRDDFSDSNSDLHETLSRLSAASQGKETQRINEWINNSPSVAVTNSQPSHEVPVVSAADTTRSHQTPGQPLQADENQDPTRSTIANINLSAAPMPPLNVAPTVSSNTYAATAPQVPYVANPLMVAPTAPVIAPIIPTMTVTTSTPATTAPTQAIPTPPLESNPVVTVPISHILPNLSAWTFSTATGNPVAPARTHSPPSQLIPTVTTTPVGSIPGPTMPVIPVTCGGTVFYVPSSAITTAATTGGVAPSTSTFPSATAAPFIPPGAITVTQPSTPNFTLQDVAQILASTRKDHLPEWKLAQFNGDPIQWHEWFGQFKSAIDSSPLTDDVKLTYLKTLVTGKAKVAIAEFAYCGSMYKDALKTLERKFGQPQAVVTAYLDKLTNVPPLKMHNSDSIISYAATVSALVGVFRSLNYVQDLSSASLLGQAVQKLPPNMKEAWSMHTVKRSLDRPTLIDFNDWLKDKAEAHERMKMASGKSKSDDVASTNATKTKTSSKVFATTTSTNQAKVKVTPKSDHPATNCVACKEKHPLWRCQVFKKKTPTERARLVADNKLCFSCFNVNHSFRQCPQPRKCTKEGCGSSHNTLLHGAERIFPNKPGAPNKRDSQTSTCIGLTNREKQAEESSGMPSVTDIKGLLQITEVELHSTDKSERALVLCDSACSHSWISSRLAKKLNAKGSPKKLTVHGINCHQVVNTEMVELKLTPVHSGGTCPPFPVKPYVRGDLHVGSDVIDVAALKTKYPHLEPIALNKYSYADVDMILGQDVFHFIRPLEYFDSDRKNTPVAVRLPLGWVLSGPLPSTSGLFSTCFKAVTSNNDTDSELADQLRSWYDMESYGAFKQVDSRSAAVARAEKILEETTYHDGSRYQVGMLWAEDESQLPNNYFSALVQLKSLERRLEKDAELKERYAQTIKDDFSKGYIVRVNKVDCFNMKNTREWYLPHHPVVHPHKPGKVRRVLNGASKFQGQSLNNALLTGPDLLQSLIHILFRFRQHQHAVSADIEGMFLQVGVIPKDRPSLRFLWREDPTAEVGVFQYVRHIFGSKDSPTCANYALRRTATDNQAMFPEAARSVLNNFYMDDYLESSPTVEEATRKAEDLVKLLSFGGFKLTKFVSNENSIPSRLEPQHDAKTEVKEIPRPEDSSHVLGLKWNHSTDTLVVSRGTNPEVKPTVTQRVVLSLVSAVYDPIGLVAPYTVKARLLLKDIWRLSGQQWDDNLPPDIAAKFFEWSQELPILGDITIPRAYFTGEIESLELHLFGDSSQEVFSAVAFLRAKVKSSKTRATTELAFVFGKARVAPMKTLTIPRLELQAALLASRLRNEIQTALTLEIDKTFMWTDSTTVLQWIHSIEKQPVFVANRVAEILDLTTTDEWNYVQSNHNPADAGTRGLSAMSLMDSSWLKGPEFLKSSDWPLKPKEHPQFKVKVKKDTLGAENVSCENEMALSANADSNTSTLEWQKYSSYEKLLRVTAYILRLLPKNEAYRTSSGSITDPDELQNAETKLLYLVQQESFPTENRSLLKKSQLNSTSKILQFSPFIGPQGLLRATGRTKQLEATTFEAKHPVLLDGRHPFTRLLLEHLHQTNCHQGVDYLRALVQQRFGIVKLRATLRSIISRCVVCRKRRAETLSPMMADLPRERLAFKEHPFTNTGVDYFGPFYVSVKRSTEKRWGFLFTCLTTRAVHFEVVPSMDTSSCLMGIERFIARRGTPSVLWSDNGTNFIASEKELLQNISNWNQKVLSDQLVKKRILWKFNPPSAPHHGGIWERVVRSFKHVFYAVLGNRRLTDEILTTTFCLVEQSLNARPLVPVSSDATDLDALTPNHFLLGSAGSVLPSHQRAEIDHRKRYVRAQAYSDTIWNRWLTEYVPSLNKRSKWSSQPERQLKTGDLVWIIEPTSPRGHYPLARIVKLNYGSDAVARSAELKTINGNLFARWSGSPPFCPFPNEIPFLSPLYFSR